MLERPPAAWNQLLAADPSATPAHRPELWEVLAQALPGTRVRFVAVEEHGETIGGAAACVERRAGTHWIHALPFLLTAAPLARPGRHAEVDLAVGGAFAELQRSCRAAGGEWSAYRGAGTPVAAEALARVPGETRSQECAILDLAGGVEAIARRLPRITRQLVRRTRAAGLVVEQAPERLEEVYALHLSQSRHWPGHRPLPLALSRRLLAHQADPPLARLFVVRDARRLLGGALVLDHARESFAWWSGTRVEGRGTGAGPLLMVGIAEWAAEHGRERFNLGGSSGRASLHTFKRSLGAASVEYPVRWLDASAASWPARVAALLQRRLRARRFRGNA